MAENAQNEAENDPGLIQIVAVSLWGRTAFHRCQTTSLLD